MKPVIFLNSHPIQYFAPLYQEIAATTDISLTVWYCSDESIREKMDKGFGKKIKWDIPLLEGYKSVFIKNNSWKPSIHKGFFGLMNFKVVSMLYKEPKSVIIVHGWAYFTHILTIVFGKLLGHKVCLRAETPLNQELQKNKTVTFFKHIYLRFLFAFTQNFLYVGKQNRMFYKALGIKEEKMLFAPYCVDNKRFSNISKTIGKEQSKIALNLPLNKKIILYSGKYISKKRPLDLLEAFFNLQDAHALLVFVGEGELRRQMESFILENDLKENVILTGFINQSEIPLYYRAADVFVMCSGVGETWGLSVNEAMNFGIPVLVSDTCGSAFDLVDDGSNGAVFKTGDIAALSLLLKEFLNKTVPEKEAIEAANKLKIEQYSYRQVISAIETVAAC